MLHQVTLQQGAEREFRKLIHLDFLGNVVGEKYETVGGETL
jgi:hypothetical protein